MESELNSILEADLVLEVLDTNGVWTSVPASVDEANNTLSYDFTELVGFTSVTASDESATLTVKPVLLDGYVRVYPNPTTDFYILYPTQPKKPHCLTQQAKKY